MAWTKFGAGSTAHGGAERRRGRRAITGAVVAVAGVVAGLMSTGPAAAAEPIRIGEINSYSAIPAFTIPYRQGWQMAVAEINQAGGVLGGRSLEVISRDDGGRPDTALRAAAELVNSARVALLAGTFFSHVGLAVADFAAHNKVLFLAAEPLSDALTWSRGNRYTFRLRPSTYMQSAMLAEQAAALPARRWVTVAPNYEYGRSAVAWFRELLTQRRPDVVFVGEQWPALGKIEAGSTVQALAAVEPEAVFNVTFGPDLAEFVREGRLRGLFADRSVVSLLTGEPEYLIPLRAEAPEGWIVTGYPWDQIDTAEHRKFVDAYRQRYSEPPRLGSLVGYLTGITIAAALEKAGSPDAEPLVAAMSGLVVDGPLGPITFRALDHQATMGAFVGRLAVENGQGKMVDWHYAKGAAYLPGDEWVSKQRP